MKERIFEHLKAKLAGFAGGVPDDYIDGIAKHFAKTVKTEEEIATVINDGAIDQIKLGFTFAASSLDKKTQQAIKTYAEKHGLPTEGEDVKTQTKKRKADEDEEPTPAWAKALMGKIGTLEGELTGIKKAEQKKRLEAQVRAGLKKAEVDEDWLIGRSLEVEKDEEVDSLVSRIAGDYQVYRQKKVEEGVYSLQPKGSSGASKAASETLATEIANRRNSPTSEGITGKKID